MAEYEIFFKESVYKVLKRILWKIESLASDPTPIGCQKLTDEERYRVR